MASISAGRGILSSVASDLEDGTGLVTYFDDLDLRGALDFREKEGWFFGEYLFTVIDERVGLGFWGAKGLGMGHLVIWPQWTDLNWIRIRRGNSRNGRKKMGFPSSYSLNKLPLVSCDF